MALDFFLISTRANKRGLVEIYPKFIVKKSNDLMIRGGDFYAIWVEERGLWSSEEEDAINLIDAALDEFKVSNIAKFGSDVKVLHMWDAETGTIDNWHRYCQKQMRDSYHMLDEKLIFSNTPTRKRDYASHRLPYPLEAGPISAFDKILSVLYSPEERMKIEWAIGAIVSGDSKKIQKFLVLYGSAGTGKSTILNIIQMLFDQYYSVFDAKALGSNSNSFALEAFKTNPLVAIQHDGDLSKIEDNTRLNSLVSHELMTVNEKFKSTYSNRFKCFLFMGTNKPVRITDAKSGLIRRLIDVTPTGDKIPFSEYKKLIKQIEFELGAIAQYCLDLYLENTEFYDEYIPTNMLSASNDFYNFVLDSFSIFEQSNGTTLKAAWEMYKNYCDEAKVPYPFSQRVFKEELKNYFDEYMDRYTLADGTRVRSYYISFIKEKFESPTIVPTIIDSSLPSWLQFKPSRTDILLETSSDCQAQYASMSGYPLKEWDAVKTTLSDLDANKLHYVRLPVNHIVIDFDISKDGKKSLACNLEAASKWPKTYAEVSKSGEGVHLHYLYTGDTSRLCRLYEEHVEIKVFTGKSALRRKLTSCNDISVNSISSGLPLKGESKMVNNRVLSNENSLRTLLKRNLNKEFQPGTKPSIDFMLKILDDAYASELSYDVSDMSNDILAFAMNSSHQSDYCVKAVAKMKLKSKEPSDPIESKSKQMIFYDVEVFMNLFICNWKKFSEDGSDKTVVRMINPTPQQIETILPYRLVGFNNRKYDNHILYARLMGYTNEQLYNLSQKIINGAPNCMFGEAYNLSYTDILDFSSKKQSLKKFEIELGITHKELGLPWDQPVPEELWDRVAEYCDFDVLATEAVFKSRHADFLARQILAEVAGMTVNDTTNSLTTRIIFGKNRRPQSTFNYRNMGNVDEKCSEVVVNQQGVMFTQKVDDYTLFNSQNQPVFPGYSYSMGKSSYRDEVVGEGGYVYAEPGMYTDVALLDIASMHPSSIVAENLFGDEYTARFKDILDARLAIKHGEIDKAKKMLDGKLAKYLEDGADSSLLPTALKIAINSVYGLTSASFENPFRDLRNVDNIVAKRGALFMVNLKHAVQERGFTVAHIKTDSIKIPNATPDIIKFVFEYGERYGYTFEHEATYKKMCLVNDAVYIAQYPDGKWTATGKQFQVPYVFKSLFSKQPIEFPDLCETKSVQGTLYLDMNEHMADVTFEEKLYAARIKPIEKRTKTDQSLLNKNPDILTEDLKRIIDENHARVFVGKVGLFCPIIPGEGAGQLVREQNGKYYAVAGTNGHRWFQSETVERLNLFDKIDRSLYETLVETAKADISKYGDFEWFVNDDTEDVRPPWEV